MRKHFLTFFLLAIIGCKSEEIPEGILGIEEMTAILIDVHIAEGKISDLKQHPDTAAVILRHFEDEIFEKHNLEREVYIKSYQYHLTNIKSLQEIYTRVVDSLNVRNEVANINSAADYLNSSLNQANSSR